MRGYGNLLQDAVFEGKKDFVRILLEFGFVVPSSLLISDLPPQG